MAERYQAQLDGFTLDIESIDDTVEKAIARYEYPYRDGAATDDLGERARVIRLRCYWFEATYPRHVEFLEHLKGRALFGLIHPKYGRMQGRIESVSIRHDDRNELAEVDLTFVQDLASQEQPALYTDVAAAGEEAFVVGQKTLQERLGQDAQGQLGSEASDILTKPLDPTQGIVAQFPGVSLKARAWLKTVESPVNAWNAAGAEAANPPGTLLAAVDFGTALPGRVIGPLARAAERYALANASLRSSPARFLERLAQGLAELRGVSGEQQHLARIAGAQRLALEASALYRDDESRRDRLRRAEATTAFDAQGHYRAPEPAGAVMDVRELERSLSLVRAEIQAALDEGREQQSLKDAGRQLLEHVNQVTLERDRIVRILLDNAMPLHLLCLRRGLSYAYAERLLALNSIPHPNFVAGEVNVYV